MTPQTPATHRHTNRLATEQSPYLLQHAHNPVDWHPWGKAAFAKARKENKPILLSVGYSTCHWCHVMERESFEDEEVGAFLNEHFVSIKVDREERPDVDRIYMTFVQATTGAGGWPMNVFLTPDLKPFYGGTYFAPKPLPGRPSFIQLLEKVTTLWATREEHVRQNADQIHQQLTSALAQVSTVDETGASVEMIRKAGDALKQAYDARHGGFGHAPKFPQPSQPELLLRYAQRFDDSEATRMVLQTCKRMAAGGIHDHLGGGFSRYSVDAEWLVPHFEKMLYDNAQLLTLYLHAYLVGGELEHARTARRIISYVVRDMSHPQGGFYSAEDADSEGQEGKFYCWTTEELKQLLDDKELRVAIRYFGVTERGNFQDHSHPEPLLKQNVLSLADEELTEEERACLSGAVRKMIEKRNTRIRPHLDDKILTSWNGLMVSGLACAAVILPSPEALEASEKNLAFLRAHLWDEKEKTLHHRWRGGERDDVQLLEDYAFLLEGVVHLYEATLHPEYLRFAVTLADGMLARFYDRERGGFWQAADETQGLILRVKEDYDGAEPSGNSVAVLSLLRLAAITGRTDYSDAATATLDFFQTRLEQTPQALPRMLQAVDFALQQPLRVVVTGDPRSAATQTLVHAAHSVYQPNKVVLGTSEPVEPFARTLASAEEAKAYLCTGMACQPPTSDPDRLRDMLR